MTTQRTAKCPPPTLKLSVAMMVFAVLSGASTARAAMLDDGFTIADVWFLNLAADDYQKKKDEAIKTVDYYKHYPGRATAPNQIGPKSDANYGALTTVPGTVNSMCDGSAGTAFDPSGLFVYFSGG